MAKAPLTPVQKRMLDALSQGQAVSKEKLHACLADDLGPVSNVRAHLSVMRKQLRANGQDIACELVAGRVAYRLVKKQK